GQLDVGTFDLLRLEVDEDGLDAVDRPEAASGRVGDRTGAGDDELAQAQFAAETAVHDVLRVQLRECAIDFDGVPVERRGEAFEPGRLVDDTGGDGIGFLGRHVGVAAGQRRGLHDVVVVPG